MSNVYSIAYIWLWKCFTRGTSGKETACMQISSLDQEDPLEEGTATHSSILVWKIPWMEEPGGLWFIGSQRVGHDWSDLACTWKFCRSRGTRLWILSMQQRCIDGGKLISLLLSDGGKGEVLILLHISLLILFRMKQVLHKYFQILTNILIQINLGQTPSLAYLEGRKWRKTGNKMKRNMEEMRGKGREKEGREHRRGKREGKKKRGQDSTRGKRKGGRG